MAEPSRNRLIRGEAAVFLEPRVMDLLVYFASRPGRVISRETILAEVWSGQLVADNTLNWSVAQLRKALGCAARRPTFIETVPKRGYRLIAEVVGLGGEPPISPTSQPDRGRQKKAAPRFPYPWFPTRPLFWSAGTLLLTIAVFGLFRIIFEGTAPTSPNQAPALEVLDSQLKQFAAPAATHPPGNLSAHDLYLLGRHHMSRRGDDSLKKAIAFFQMAIDRDANFPLGYAGLSNAYGLMAVWGNLSFAEVAAPRREAVQKALALDNQSAEAYIALGGLHYHHGRYEHAVQAFRRGLDLDPDHVTGHQWLGDAQRALGFYREAGESHRRARELEPLSPIVNLDLGSSLHLLGFHDRGLGYMEEAVALDTDFAAAYQHIGRVHRDLGRLDQAVFWLRRTHELEPERVEPLLWLGEIYLDLGQKQQVRSCLNKLESIEPQNSRTSFFRYRYLVEVGQVTRARNAASQAAEELGDPGSLLELAYLEYLAGNYGAALDHYRNVDGQAYLEPSAPVRMCNWRNMLRVGFLYTQNHEREKGRLLLRKIAAFAEKNEQAGYRLPYASYMRASLASVHGDAESACLALREAISGGWRGWWSLRHEAYWNPIRDDSCFAQILLDSKAYKQAAISSAGSL